MNEHRIKVEIPITNQDLKDIIHDCLTSICTYWIESTEVTIKYNEDLYKASDILIDDLGEISISLSETDKSISNRLFYKLTKKKLLMGIRRYMINHYKRGLDIQDSHTKDLIMQYALFNKQVFQ